jgi:hypothetical protein
MKTRTLILLLAALAAPAAAHAILEATPLTAREQPALGGQGSIPWPARAPAPFAVRTITLSFEHQPQLYLQFSTGNVTLQARQSDLDDWQIHATGPQGLNLTNRWNPDVDAFITWFPAGSFLPSLANQPWNSYLRGLRRRHAGKLTFEFNDDTDTNPQMLQIMGRRTRLLGFRAEGDEENPAQAQLQVAVELPGGILVIGMQGPPRSLLQCRTQFQRLVTGLEPLNLP